MVSEEERPVDGMWKFWPEVEVWLLCALVVESMDLPSPSLEGKRGGPDKT